MVHITLPQHERNGVDVPYFSSVDSPKKGSNEENGVIVHKLRDLL